MITRHEKVEQAFQVIAGMCKHCGLSNDMHFEVELVATRTNTREHSSLSCPGHDIKFKVDFDPMRYEFVIIAVWSLGTKRNFVRQKVSAEKVEDRHNSIKGSVEIYERMKAELIGRNDIYYSANIDRQWYDFCMDKCGDILSGHRRKPPSAKLESTAWK